MTKVAEVLADAAGRLEAAGIGDEARLEGELLLGWAMGVDRAHVLASLGQALGEDVLARFEEGVQRREGREPLSYITGSCEFYGIEIECSPAALIPRPETEMLVDLALEEIERRDEGVRLVDVGTGTGAVAVAIAVRAPGIRVVATDVSADALELARRNAERHGVLDRVEFVETDLLAGLGKFDVIVANLPYVTEAERAGLQPEVRDWEPDLALFGGADGTDLVRRLLLEAPRHLAAGGVLAAEIGHGQGAALRRAAGECFPWAEVDVPGDFAGLERVVVVRR